MPKTSTPVDEQLFAFLATKTTPEDDYLRDLRAAAADRGRAQASKRALDLIVSAPDRGPCGDREGSGIQPASPMPAQPKKV